MVRVCLNAASHIADLIVRRDRRNRFKYTIHPPHPNAAKLFRLCATERLYFNENIAFKVTTGQNIAFLILHIYTQLVAAEPYVN